MTATPGCEVCGARSMVHDAVPHLAARIDLLGVPYGAPSDAGHWPVTVEDDHARMTYSPSKGATFQPRNRP